MSLIRPIEIGKCKLSTNLILAPMSGVTNSSFRRLIYGENPESVGLLVTEFISIEGLVRKNEQSMRMMRFRDAERPISIQIFGHSIDSMVEAARMVEAKGADIVDINCGCPAPKVVKRGGGCELMRQPKHLENMLSAVRRAVSIPLTLKIRSGWDETSINAMDIAVMAQDCGVEMLAVHGRTRQTLYRGEADWDIVAAIAQRLSIPVIGSGDVVCAESAKRSLESGVAGLMIGRRALSNPWIFSEIRSGIEGKPFEVPGDLETPSVLRRYLSILKEELPERTILGRMKQFTSQVTRRVHGSTPARRAMCISKTLVEFENALSDWEQFLQQRGEQRSRMSSYPNISKSEAEKNGRQGTASPTSTRASQPSNLT
jgi:nifR3 family TIM-barrel protein